MGRYFFAPDDTPHLSSTHHLGSRRWHNADCKYNLELGENLTTPQPWYNGAAPVVRPFPRVVGAARCLEVGENLASAIRSSELIDGFPRLCFTPEDRPDEQWLRVSEFTRCVLQKLYAAVIDWLYALDVARINRLFLTWLGASAVVTVHAGTTLLPPVCTVVHPQFSIIICAGTENFQQLATQAFLSIRRPTNYGILSTHPLWYNASNWVNDFAVADGVDENKPVLLVGHSYGGATASILAARYRAANPLRQVRYITYGCPKIGDVRLVDWLSG